MGDRNTPRSQEANLTTLWGAPRRSAGSDGAAGRNAGRGMGGRVGRPRLSFRRETPPVPGCDLPPPRRDRERHRGVGVYVVAANGQHCVSV